MRRPLIVLLLVAALAPTSAMAAAWIRCDVDREARKSCCCPAEEREEDPSRTPELGARSCCDVDQLAGRTLDARVLPDVLAIVFAPPVRDAIRIAPTEIAAIADRARVEVAQPRGPPSLFAQGSLLLV